MFYYDMGDHHVVGASPEILVRLEGDNVTVAPIAGTRPRGKTPSRMLTSLKNCWPIERAGRTPDADRPWPQRHRPCAERGTVKLTDKMVIERYSHVMHIVSNVEAKLKPGMNTMDVLKATFLRAR